MSHDKTCLKVFLNKSYRRNTVEMTLFQKYEVSCSQTKCCLKFYIEKIACKYYK